MAVKRGKVTHKPRPRRPARRHGPNQPDQSHYTLRLYVAGLTPRSQRAMENIQRLCEEHLEGRYDLRIVDVYQEPEQAKVEQILAAPTLIKKLPSPLRRIIGDLSSSGKVLLALGLSVNEGSGEGRRER